MAKNRDLIFAGFLLCLLGALAALFEGVIDVANWVTPPIPSSINPLFYGIVLIVLGIVSLMLTFRARRVREILLPILLLIFSLIIIFVAGIGISLGFLGGLLLLIGSILFLVARS